MPTASSHTNQCSENRNCSAAFACRRVEVCLRKANPKRLLKRAVFVGEISRMTEMGFHLILLYSTHRVQGIIREVFYFLRGGNIEVQRPRRYVKKCLWGKRKRRKKEKTMFTFRILPGMLKALSEDLCWSRLVQMGCLSLITKPSLRVFNAYCWCQIQPPTFSRI